MGIRTKNLHNYILELSVRNTLSATSSASVVIAPFSGFITNIYTTLSSIGNTTSMVLDIHKNGTTIFGASTKITGSTSSKAISYSDLASDNYGIAAGDILALDVDAADVGTVNAIVNVTISKTPVKQPSHLVAQDEAL